jgi:hypothetical protein
MTHFHVEIEVSVEYVHTKSLTFQLILPPARSLASRPLRSCGITWLIYSGQVYCNGKKQRREVARVDVARVDVAGVDVAGVDVAGVY